MVHAPHVAALIDDVVKVTVAVCVALERVLVSEAVVAVDIVNV